MPMETAGIMAAIGGIGEIARETFGRKTDGPAGGGDGRG